MNQLQTALKQLRHTSSNPATLQSLVAEILKIAPDDLDIVDSLRIAVKGKTSADGTVTGRTSAGRFTTMIGNALRGDRGTWRIDSEGRVVLRLSP